MEKKLLESVKENNSEDLKEYFDFVKASVADKSYFKDGLDWYCFRYLKPVCDRTFLIFGSLISVVIFYFLIEMIKSSYPLVEKKPIIVYAKDQTTYFPNLVELKPKDDELNYDPNIKTIDQALSKYLVGFYIKERESFDFSAGTLDSVNKKFNRIRNLSTLEEYRAFQLFMSKDNPNSPIQYFGKNVTRTVTIDSVRFIDQAVESDFASKAKDFLVNKIPTYAEVRFTTTTKTMKSEYESEDVREKFLVKVDFLFEGANKEQKGDLNFVVKEYKLFRVR